MSTRRALAFSFLDRYAGLLLSIGSSMVIARLLTPSQIGVFSVTVVLLQFVSSLRDMGAGQYLVQARELTSERVRAAWTVQLGMGVFFALLVLVAARPVAQFYREPVMLQMMLLLALNFAISPFGSITYAFLMRDMAFGKLAVLRFLSGLAGAIVSISLAWQGWGPISLAYGSLAATVTNALCAQLFRPPGLPWFPGGWSAVREVLSFGSKISATTIVNNACFSSPELALGRLQTMTDVGLFSRANGLVSMFNKLVMDAVNSVVMTVFAKDARAGIDPRPGFLRAISYITAIGWFFSGMVGLYAPAIIHLLYGDQWQAATPLARSLSAGIAIGLIAALCPTALTALGQVRGVLVITIWVAIIYSALMVSGAWLGIEWMGAAFIVANICGVAMWLRLAKLTIGFTLSELGVVLCRSFAVAATGLAPAVALYLLAGSHRDTNSVLLLASLLGSVAAAWASFHFCHPLASEIRNAANQLQKRNKRHRH